ncbi:MAG: protein kinase [Myxococcota bacterium]
MPPPDAATSPPSADGAAHGVTPGTLIGARFRVEAWTGRGLFGDLFRCRDATTGRLVALRVLPRTLFPENLIERLRVEVRLAVSLDHRNVAAGFGIGREGALRYTVGEHLDGQSLRDLVERKRREGRALGFKGALSLALHLATALDHAHRTMLHGALAPSSVLVSSAGRVRICDFGLARALADPPRGADGVDLACLAPELADGADCLTPRSDVYGIGALMYFAVTGHAPARALEPAQGFVPDLPDDLDPFFAQCLALDPDARFADPAALRVALLSLVGTPIAAGPVLVAPIEPSPAHAASAKVAPPKTPPRPPAAPKSPPATPPHPRTDASPRPQGRTARATLTAGLARVSGRFRVGSLLGSSDESAERWLVQRDRLDFGPFSLDALKKQIRADQFDAQHVIVDQATGERGRIGDHPLLTAFMAELAAERERKRRDEADRATHVAEKRGTTVVWGTLLALGAACAFAVVWWVSRAPDTKDAMVYRDRAAEIEGGLKAIDIAWKPRAKGAKRAARKGGAGAGASSAPGSAPTGADEFDSAVMLGDAEQAGGDEQLSEDVIQDVMIKSFGLLKGCVLEERRRNRGLASVDMDFIVHGDGHVSAVRVNGERGGALHDCMLGQMKRVSFPKYDGPRTQAGFSMSLK